MDLSWGLLKKCTGKGRGGGVGTLIFDFFIYLGTYQSITENSGTLFFC
jgi:hypothetical protein